MVFGNDSFLALAKGPIGVKLATLADAYFTVLLGFFITPDNSGYLALGLAAAFVTLGLLVFSYFWRARSLDQDAALIRHLARADDLRLDAANTSCFNFTITSAASRAQPSLLAGV